jgi:hypothetical protein
MLVVGRSNLSPEASAPPFARQPAVDVAECLQQANSQMSANAGVPNKHSLYHQKMSRAKSSFLDPFRAGLNLRVLPNARRMLVTGVAL